MHSWRVLVLPYMEQNELYDKYDFTQPWNSAANLRLESEMPRVFAFHGEYEQGTVTTNFLAVIGDETVWPGATHRTDAEITDKLSNTILFVENTGEKVHWMEPRDLHFDSMSLKLHDAHGVSSKYVSPAVVMLDCSLRKLEDQLPKHVFRALLTANGGEPLESTGDTWRLLSDGRLREEREIAAEKEAEIKN